MSAGKEIVIDGSDGFAVRVTLVAEKTTWGPETDGEGKLLKSVEQSEPSLDDVRWAGLSLVHNLEVHGK